MALLALSTLAAPTATADAAAGTGTGGHTALATATATPKPPSPPKPTPSPTPTTSQTKPATGGKAANPGRPTTPALPAAPAWTPPKPSPEQQAEQDKFQSEAAARAKAKSTGKAVPVDADTTETTLVSANPDGSFSAATSLNPERVRLNGAWTPIDATLTLAADGSVQTRATTLGITFSGGGTAPMIRLDDRSGHVLTVTWPTDLPKPTLSGTAATYPNVFPGVDLVLTAGASTYSEVLVVHDAEAAANPALKTIRLGMSGPGLTVSADTADGVKVTDAAGNRVFSGPPAAAWDSAPATAAGTAAAAAPAAPLPAHYTALPTKAVPGGVELTPDQQLLTGAATKYPVFIDPAEGYEPGYWAELWSCPAWRQTAFIGINSSQSITYPGGGTNQNVIRAGYYPGGACAGPVRSMLEFEIAHYGSDGDNINSASVDIYEQDPGPNCVGTDLWTADPVDGQTGYPYPTWYNTATVDGFWQGTRIGTGACLGGNNQHVEFNVTSQVRIGVGARNPDITFGLRTTNEASGNFEAFYVQNNGAYDPTINVNYNMPPTIGATQMDSTNGYLPKLPGASPSYLVHTTVADADTGRTLQVTFSSPGWPGTVTQNVGSNAQPGIAVNVTAAIPASWFTDGTSYAIAAQAEDTWSGLVATASFNPSYTAAFSPPSQPTITSGTDSSGAAYFPPSAIGQQATAPAGTAVTNAFHIASTLTHANAPKIWYFDYVVNGDSSLAGPNNCTAPIECGEQGTSTNDMYLSINSAVTHAGMNSLFVKAFDMAGNMSWNSEYDFFVPATFVPTVWGSVVGDSIPDIMAIAPMDPSTAGSPSHLVTFPTDMDPSKSVTQGWAGNWLESSKTTDAPDGVSWAGSLITHRGADRVQPYDDLFAWKNGQLYYYMNTLMSTSNPTHSPVDAFTKTQYSVVNRPVCTACGPSYAGDWSKVQQIVALGPEAGGVPGSTTAKTSLITVEDDGDGGANLWLFDAAGIGQVRAPRLIASCSIVIPGQARCPAGWNWAKTTLVAPGNAAGHPAGADGKAASGLPDLWVRDNTSGTLYMFPNRLVGGVEDPTALGDFATRVQLGGAGQFNADTYPSLFSNGNVEQGGNGLPDLWALTPNGQLNLIQSPSNTGGAPIPSTSMQTVSSAGWAGSYGLSTIDTAPLNPGTGPLTLTPRTGALICLDDTGGSAADGNPIATSDCDGTVNQAWTFASDGTVRWTGSTDANGDYNKCLDIKADSTTDNGTFQGTPVQLWDCDTSAGNGGNQKWQIRLDPSGKGALYNPQSGLCLDDPDSTTNSGTQFWIWKCTNGNNAQLWVFPGTAGGDLKGEAENLPIEPGATIAPVVQDNCCGVTWSDNAQLWFTATSAGSTFTIDYYVPIAGTYVVAPAMTKAQNYGTVQLSIDGQAPLPNTFDGYNPSVTTGAFRFGTARLSAGTHKFTFTVPGKNPAASGYEAGIDSLNLNWTADTDPYLSVNFPASALVGVSTTTDASASLGGADAISGYTFDFGDGSTPATGSQATASHVYTAPGTYTITATATDSAGESSTLEKQVSLTTGPSSVWKLSDQTGTTAADTGTSAAHPAALNGGAAFNAGGYMMLDGSTGHAATAAAAIDTTKSFTVSAWVDLSGSSGYQTFVTQQGNQAGGFHLEFENNGSQGDNWTFARAASDTANAVVQRANSPAGLPQVETWTHLIGTWDATTGAMALYVNGQLVGTGSDTTPVASTGPLDIGRGWSNATANNYTGGGIADVQVYQQAFDGDLASWLYRNSGFTPPAAPVYALAAPTALTSSDGTAAACGTDPANPATSTSATPALGATLADPGLHADFEMRDVTDPTLAPPLYFGGAGGATAPGAAVSLTAPTLVNGHEYAFSARSHDAAGTISATAPSCYLRVSVGGQTAVHGTGAVGTFMDNTIYPASAGPISWAGPVTTLTWQKDGNLVLYKKDGRPIWASNTAGNPGATLDLQNNGNLVIRPGMPLMNSTGMLIGVGLWSSATAGTNAYALVEQTDGNAVLDSPTGAAFGTNGNVETFANLAVDNCLDSSNGSVYTGACNGGGYQNWIIIPNSDGSWELQDSASGQCLDGNGTSVYASPCGSGNDYQHWFAMWTGTGWILTHKVSGQVLDSNTGGTPYFNTRNGGSSQQWH
ncbi:ricin-type beta-trefoil lectin domain protein [Catenulispora sp. NL8]|uniref:Ricin-type beta-trefoil lectin domain protein n=1 Tax=Catenulispora pinistramenti TaxID=2705254 RepID=A0ABS5KG72_9ACTN|nr:ricin-type beta-trefoil lectin domain protein [Catenulispora pinistramenti]MBS2545247.1 ricin-type beta-trefoil lectin domain protein [Catenulispora pinistramenti]